MFHARYVKRKQVETALAAKEREFVCVTHGTGKSSVFIQDIKWSTSSGKHKPKLVHLTHSVPLKTVTVNLHL